MHPSWMRQMSRLETLEDREKQEAVARILESVWKCQIHTYPGFHAIDWYAVRGDRLVMNLELKVRQISSTDYETIFLSLRKWHTLYLTAIASRVPSVFVVKYTNEIRWIDVFKVQPHELQVDARGGRTLQYRRPEDIEPIIHVPIKDMKQIGGHG